MTPDTPAQASQVREKVARIIDPEAWAKVDGHRLAIEDLTGGPLPALCAHLRAPHEDAVEELSEDSLALADSILALISEETEELRRKAAGFTAEELLISAVEDRKLRVAAEDRADTAEAERDELRGALDMAAKRFRHYEQLHAAKGTPDGDAKAQNNADMAAVCELALSRGGQNRRAPVAGIAVSDDTPTPEVAGGREPVSIWLQEREDGGLRVWSDMLPGLILSNSNAALVSADIWPAIQTLVEHNEVPAPQLSGGGEDAVTVLEELASEIEADWRTASSRVQQNTVAAIVRHVRQKAAALSPKTEPGAES